MVTGEDRKRNNRGTKKVPTDGHQEEWTLTEFIPFVQFHLPDTAMAAALSYWLFARGLKIII